MKDEGNTGNTVLEIGAGRDMRSYIGYLDVISKAMLAKLEELETMNQALKEENDLLRNEAKDRESEFYDLVSQDKDITKRCIELEQRVAELAERLEKEQKRTRLLETENARNMDELKSLRKENKSLLSLSSDKEKLGLGDRIKGIFRGKDS